MAVLTPRQQLQAGSIPAPVAATAGGDRMPVGPNNYLRVSNASGGSLTVTIDSVTPCSQGFDHDLVVAVAAGVTKEIGPITSRFASLADGLAAITYSGVTSLTVEAVQP